MNTWYTSYRQSYEDINKILFQKQNLHEFVYISIGRGDYSYIHSQTTKSGWPLYSGLQNYYITSQTNNCLHITFFNLFILIQCYRYVLN